MYNGLFLVYCINPEGKIHQYTKLIVHYLPFPNLITLILAARYLHSIRLMLWFLSYGWQLYSFGFIYCQ